MGIINRTRSKLLDEKAETALDPSKYKKYADRVFCLETALAEAQRLGSPHTADVFDQLIAEQMAACEDEV